MGISSDLKYFPTTSFVVYCLLQWVLKKNMLDCAISKRVLVWFLGHKLRVMLVVNFGIDKGRRIEGHVLFDETYKFTSED